MFDVKSLIFEQIAFEVRYEQGYLYWDTCGKIWKEILEKHPEVKANTVSVETASLSIEDKELNINFSPTAISITQKYPENLKIFTEISDSVTNIIAKSLGVETFSRVGNRFFYFLEIEDSNEAIKYLKNTGFFSVSDEKMKKIGDTIKEPSVKFVITKNDDTGHIFNFKYMDRMIKLQIPKPIKYDKSSFASKGLSLDVDYYTMKAVDLSILKCSDLIKKNKKNIDYYLTEIFSK